MSLGWPGNASGIPPEELEEVSRGEGGGLGISAQTAASATRSRTKRMKMDGWINKLTCQILGISVMLPVLMGSGEEKQTLGDMFLKAEDSNWNIFESGSCTERKGKILRKKKAGEKDTLDGLCIALAGIRDTFSASWRSVLVDNNRIVFANMIDGNILQHIGQFRNQCKNGKSWTHQKTKTPLKLIKLAVIDDFSYSEGCQFQGPGVVPAGSLSWLTGTSKWREAIINIISSTCAFPAMTSQNAVE
ncbi:hypothetical protein L3Q82_017720 [Scortum barcoo]|uniref:Uncharacterized protein n=1 Tax=Scortum barcoo TaxID=214431 RepID=A0ACB8VM02_9TELE|nr:hypothetical protein L3Q82_017720 [Scortum barcoo]